jgi:Uma2 family endonuclease
MSDGSVNRGRILRNLMRLMDVTCGHSLYEVLPRGVQIWLPEPGLGFYPDLMVVAGQPLLHDGRSDRVLNPCVIFEIAPDSTAPWAAIASPPQEPSAPTQGHLFDPCQAISYLQIYVLVHQNQPRVEQVFRTEDNRWEVITQTSLDTVVELAITNARLPLMDIYERVEFSLLV